MIGTDLLGAWLDLRGRDLNWLFGPVYQGKPVNRDLSTTTVERLVKQAAVRHRLADRLPHDPAQARVAHPPMLKKAPIRSRSDFPREVPAWKPTERATEPEGLAQVIAFLRQSVRSSAGHRLLR